MISDDRFGLMPLWNSIFEIYKIVSGICERHNLRYYVTDGTAIGAVRHQGFIPWDDDFDISMPRPDYERFINLAKTELPQHLKFLNWKNTPEFFYLFGKVQDCRENVVLEMEKNIGRKLSNGIFIDIFPIDGYPASRWGRLWVKCSTFIPNCIVHYRCMKYGHQKGAKGRIAWIIGGMLSVFLPWISVASCMAYCERRLRAWEFTKCEQTGRTCSSMTVLRRAPLAKKAWGKPVPHEFHDGVVMLPTNCDAHLKNEYPTRHYMTMPPEDQRKPTHGYAWRCAWWLGPTKSHD